MTIVDKYTYNALKKGLRLENPIQKGAVLPILIQFYWIANTSSLATTIRLELASFDPFMHLKMNLYRDGLTH